MVVNYLWEIRGRSQNTCLGFWPLGGWWCHFRTQCPAENLILDMLNLRSF